jgi:dihydroorotate dehydrogenase (fumarate)
MKLRTPIVPSASPLSEDLDNIKRMEDAGAAAVVCYSLFEEQIRLERYELHHHLTAGTESYPESLTYFPEPAEFKPGRQDTPSTSEGKGGRRYSIVASLNGCSLGGWTDYAPRLNRLALTP